MHVPRKAALLVAGALSLSIGSGIAYAAGGLAANITSSTPYFSSYPNHQVRDPGSITIPTASGSQTIIFSTGGPDSQNIVEGVPGRWTTLTKRMLNTHAPWVRGTDYSMWAPSVLHANGHYVLFYSAIRVAATKSSPAYRCIGTAVSAGDTIDPAKVTTPYLFTVKPQPLVCFGGVGADDLSTSATFGDKSKKFSIIDATPALLDRDPKDPTSSDAYLTYKTEVNEANNRFHTTLRLVNLNDADPSQKIAGTSKHLTDLDSTDIEENPVMVEYDHEYTLFSSYGLFGQNCTSSNAHAYHTVYRVSASKWDWPAPGVQLPVTTASQTCGDGNADVFWDGKEFRIFFNGKYFTKKPKTNDDFKSLGFELYTGILSYSAAHKTWAVTTVNDHT